MCTVTYIPVQKGFYLTSNRDEKATRLKSTIPKWYDFASGKILFPKDGNAGGTWIALHENRNAMVLLNGGFQNHQYTPPYRKSRGLIYLDIFDHPKPVNAFEKINLLKIEPFTLIIRQQQQLFEAIWDGNEKVIKELDAKQSYIWSSVTLYPEQVINNRKKWFQNFHITNTEINKPAILNFHRFAGEGDKANDVLMNRDNKIFTVSITMLHQEQENSNMHYFDLLMNKKFTIITDHSIPTTTIHESV
jgi:Transport and Golgi organisation 2